MATPTRSGHPGTVPTPVAGVYARSSGPTPGIGLTGVLFWGVRNLLLFGGWVLPLSEVLHQLFRPDPTWLTARLPPLAALLYRGVVPLVETLLQLWPLWLLHSVLLLGLAQLLSSTRLASLFASLVTLSTAWHLAPAGLALARTYPDAAWIAGIVLVWATYGWVAGERPVGTRAVEVAALDRVVVLLSIVTLGLAAVLYLVPGVGGLLAGGASGPWAA